MNDDRNKPEDDWGMTMPHMRLAKEKNADDFSNEFSDDFAPNSNPSPIQPPTDEWGMTTPNLNLSKNSSSSDFDKTTPNINISRDIWADENPPPLNPLPADDWGISTPNDNISSVNNSATNQSDDWGMSLPDINVPGEAKSNQWSMPDPVFRKSEGEKLDDVARRTGFFNLKDLDNFEKSKSKESYDFDKTAANFNFAENPPPSFESVTPDLNFQTPPEISNPIPVTQVIQEAKPPAKSNNSKWLFIGGGLLAMFLFAVVSVAGAYFFFLRKPTTVETAAPVKTEPQIETLAPTAPNVPADVTLPKTIEYKGTMVLVSAGEFSMGSDSDADESKPSHKVTLPAYYIDKTEVANAEYKAFCDATNKTYPPNPHLEKDYFLSRPNAPVVGVSFADAKAYADWAGKRLPTEEEWEKAASWDENSQTKREFPWGNDFQKSNVAFGTSKISDVGKFSTGASPFGALDMSGNVLEWVDAFFQPYPNSPSSNAEFGEKNRIVRGGHFGSKSSDSLKTTKRIYVSPDIASGEDDEKLIAAIIGFRCAVSADDKRVANVLTTQQGK